MKKRVVIVGAGFAGINLANELSSARYEVCLLDQLNYHQFQPLLYQVATAQIEPSSISFPIRYLFRKKKNVLVQLAKALRVDADQKVLMTDRGTYKYDYLVLAMGGTTNFFGNGDLQKFCIPLKSTSDALKIRNHILENFENIAQMTGDRDESLYNIVIVGAGPTGIEMSGALAEIKRDILPKDFRHIDFSKLRIILMEGGAATLGTMSVKSQQDSRRYLENLGVEVMTQTTVVSYDGEVLTTNNGEKINTRTVIWSAGIVANKIQGIPEAAIGRGGRLIVNRWNELQGISDVYVIGDMALMQTPRYPNGHPQLANVAIHQARNLAANWDRVLQGKTRKEYEYKDLGTMATIGRNIAVVDVGKIHLKGILAWLIWMFLHLMLIVSVRNRLIIFINWAWAYFTKNSSLRIIIRDKSENV